MYPCTEVSANMSPILKNLLLTCLLLPCTYPYSASAFSPKNDYLSITCTPYQTNQEGVRDTCIYQYTPHDKEVHEVYHFPLTAQYPLGVFHTYDRTLYYTKRDASKCDQIFSYNLDTKEECQLTHQLFAVNYIIPTESHLFFVAARTDALHLGVINKKTHVLSYWGDEDTTIETIALNPHTQKIYISAFSYSEDRKNIEAQFTTEPLPYILPIYTVYETDYAFESTKTLVSKQDWIRLLLIHPTHPALIVVYDKEHNSSAPSKALSINLDTYEITSFNLPPERFQQGGAYFSSDGNGIYSLSSVEGQRGLYFYDLKTQSYIPIFICTDGFINNFQLLH